MTPRATPGDIEWIDTYGQARICGLIVHKATIQGLERPSDRRLDGYLTAAAKERLADQLTAQLVSHDQQSRAAQHAAREPAIWRFCNG
ncbi:hypothetical protein FB566_2974 [Stackebrandtia endophytica]|uniref:Uncharacterized protein n=1 Tax=Stackebrandtia endophytica TaxID=1496996 RepID=A0A543AXW2_9ACTN|nr:hypothetical protein [Stackebrandtia endophytica]TQL77415.1 hypothetical protein FB566_2974 [Stackebrandtia endophytica]